jgi:hypothetical protein
MKRFAKTYGKTNENNRQAKDSTCRDQKPSRNALLFAQRHCPCHRQTKSDTNRRASEHKIR